MVHEAKSQSPAIIPASAASTRRKRLILLCSEDLRPIACSLEDALRSRGWQVDLELGADAKPWVQKVPPVRPSLRVLCVPGSIDRALAKQLRQAFQPEPDADLHILGVDDSPSLVHEIERLAGVEQPRPRSLHARPRLAHATLVETQVRAERRWLVGATSALAAFAITLGGIALVEHSARAPELSALSAASLTAPITTPITTPGPSLDDDRPEPSRVHDPVLAAAAPVVASTAIAWDDELLPPEEDDEVVLLDDDELDEPQAAAPTTLRDADVVAPPLAEPSSAVTITEPLTPPAKAPQAFTIAATVPALPSGLVAVDELPLTDAVTTEPKPQLPAGFLPVAGLTVAPRITTVDPFADRASPAPSSIASAPVTTVDPFGATVDAATP